MKRRKTLNKYTVGDHGQIINNNPVLSPRTQKLLEIMTFSEMLKEFSSGNIGLDLDDIEPTEEDPTITNVTSDEEVNEKGCVINEPACD